MKKEISLEISLFYLIISITSVSIGRIFITYFSNKNIGYNIKLLFNFIIISILCYIFSFKLISKSSNKLYLKIYLIKVIPLFLIITLLIRLFLIKINLI